jgi:hypothetical protein
MALGGGSGVSKVAARFGNTVARRGMKIVVHREGRKGDARFPKPAYIRWITDEYRRACNGSPVSHVFGGS